MPKDLSKLSLKELDQISEGESPRNQRWQGGSRESTPFRSDYREDDDRDA